MGKEPHHLSCGALFRRPALYPHRQRGMEGKAAALAIADHPQILGAAVPGKIQVRGVLDEQILPRRTASLACALLVGLGHRGEIHGGMVKETIGGLEFRPVGAGLGQSAVGMGGQPGGDRDQGLTQPGITQRSLRKLMAGPLGRREQGRITHKPLGEEPLGWWPGRVN